jgi:hypothetical protein
MKGWNWQSYAEVMLAVMDFCRISAKTIPFLSANCFPEYENIGLTFEGNGKFIDTNGDFIKTASRQTLGRKKLFFSFYLQFLHII